MAFGPYDPNNPDNYKGHSMNASSFPAQASSSALSPPAEEIPAILCEVYGELEDLRHTVTILSNKVAPALRPQSDATQAVPGASGQLPVTAFGKTLRDHLLSIAETRERLQDLVDRLAL